MRVAARGDGSVGATPRLPRGLEVARLRRLLAGLDPARPLGERIEAVSRRLLGCPYRPHSLIGSADTPEVFTASLDGFDCVTYVETVVALALSRTPVSFAAALRRLRYRGGRVDWRRRNHYMTSWIRNNQRAGLVRDVVPGRLAVTRRRRLDVVPGLPPRRARVRCVPKRRFAAWRDRLASGDLLFFASTRPRLDVFHCGVLVRSGGRFRLRHARRSRGRVVEEPVAGFLRAHRMAGVLAARPREPARRPV